ncbi:hypothetical protein TWF694_007208 [Orbilia ellipsospora]|uniref:Uncharacterized protein n=1 Tax=Orbilia ellipsospora TaxID=2528407 RepID=A0AAV9XHG8_9PEZI
MKAIPKLSMLVMAILSTNINARALVDHDSIETHPTTTATKYTSQHISEHTTKLTRYITEHTTKHITKHTAEHTTEHTPAHTTHKSAKPELTAVANAQDDGAWSTDMPISTTDIMSTMTTMMTTNIGSNDQIPPSGYPPFPTESVRPPRYMQNFTQNFGPLDKIQARCINNQQKNIGATFDDVVELLSSKFTQSYTIDQYGCHQVMCLGSYSILQLCNLKPKTASIYFSNDNLKTMVRYLRDMWRPQWKEDQVTEQLNFETKVVTGCGRNNGMLINLGESMHGGGMQNHGHGHGMHEDNTHAYDTMSATITSAYFEPVPSAGPKHKREKEYGKHNMTYTEEHNKHKMTSTGEYNHNKTKGHHEGGHGGDEEGHDGGNVYEFFEIEPDMYGLGFVNDTLTGMILNTIDGSMGGWALAIDSTKNGGKCDKVDNWEGEQCSGVHSSGMDCTWDYTSMGDMGDEMDDMY